MVTPRGRQLKSDSTAGAVNSAKVTRDFTASTSRDQTRTAAASTSNGGDKSKGSNAKARQHVSSGASSQQAMPRYVEVTVLRVVLLARV